MSITGPDTNQLHRHWIRIYVSDDSSTVSLRPKQPNLPVYDLDGTHDLVCWTQPCFPAALHPYILVLVLVSLFITQFPLTSRYLERWLHLLVMVLANCVCSFRLLKHRWFVIVTLSFFHYGLRCALVGCALTCALACSFVLPLFAIFLIGVPTLGADGYVLSW